MDQSGTTIPGFRGVLTGVGTIYVLLALMNLARGASEVLAPFSFPTEVIASPLFLDFYHWLFVHMCTIGVLLVLLGQLVVGWRNQRWVVWALLALELHYAYLDLRTSVWGNGLYGDPKSLVLVGFDALVTLAFMYLCVRSLLEPRADTPGG